MRISNRRKILAIAETWLVCFVAVQSSLLAQQAATANPELTHENYAAWRDHIAPQASDLGWQQIPWLTTFQDGILAANDAQKPLLFWTMNGHPLGCT